MRSTVVLLVTYVLVTVAAQAFAGVGEEGIGLANPEHSDDVLSSVGEAVLGGWGVKALIMAVLTSAAASTQTTILPTARTTLSMAAYKALPQALRQRCTRGTRRRPCRPGRWAWSRSPSTPV